ncbi:MAG: hypothetical protein IKO27_07450 [Ruminococcus sp.]|nr:hypothetical protein [Ruminococcus sp.]
MKKKKVSPVKAAPVQQSKGKSLAMRIIVLGVAAAMVVGIVVGAVTGIG